MILVTGAAGKTGKAVVKSLAAKGASVRALIRRPEQAVALEAWARPKLATAASMTPARCCSQQRARGQSITSAPMSAATN